MKKRIEAQTLSERLLAISEIDQKIGLPIKYALIPFAILSVWLLNPEEFSHPPLYIGLSLFLCGTLCLAFFYSRGRVQKGFGAVLACVWLEVFYIGFLHSLLTTETIRCPFLMLFSAPVVKAGLLSVSMGEYLLMALSSSLVLLIPILFLKPLHIVQPNFG